MVYQFTTFSGDGSRDLSFRDDDAQFDYRFPLKATIGAGTKATAAAINRAAAAAPASSARTRARRGGMAGGYQYHAAAAPSSGNG